MVKGHSTPEPPGTEVPILLEPRSLPNPSSLRTPAKEGGERVEGVSGQVHQCGGFVWGAQVLTQTRYVSSDTDSYGRERACTSGSSVSENGRGTPIFYNPPPLPDGEENPNATPSAKKHSISSPEPSEKQIRKRVKGEGDIEIDDSAAIEIELDQEGEEEDMYIPNSSPPTPIPPRMNGEDGTSGQPE